MKKRFTAILTLLCILWGMQEIAVAAEIGPLLQQELMRLEPAENISVIVTMEEQPDVKALRAEGNRAIRSGKQGLQAFRRGMLQAFKSRADRSQRVLRQLLKAKGKQKFRELWLINGLEVSADRELIDTLSRTAGVARVELNRAVPLAVELPLVATSEPEVNLAAIGAPDLWALGIVGQGTVVANLDSGVSLTHPSLSANWRGGDNSWFDPSGVYPLPYDDDGHGTASMGIMTGADADGRAISVAPGAKWIAAKVFNDGEGAYADFHQSFQWILDPDDNLETDDAPDVVNNSWSISLPGFCDTFFELDIEVLKAAGIAVVFSAGNSGLSPSPNDLSPANNSSGYGVGMVENNSPYTISSSSSRGPSSCDNTIFPELVAPGVGIYVPTRTLSFDYVSGTSFAAPHVAGAMALLRSALPNVTVAEMEQVLLDTAVDLGQAGPDNEYGSGLMNVAAAFEQLSGFDVTPLSQNFGEALIGETSLAQTFTVTSMASRSITVAPVALEGTDQADFTVLADNCANVTLTPGDQCDLTIQFNPVGVGERNASALISIVALGELTKRVSLSGRGMMEIVAPLSGTILTSGEVASLQWTGASNVASYKLKYSRDGGASWDLIDVANAPASSFGWAVPNVVSAKPQSFFKVLAYDGIDGTGTKIGIAVSEAFTIQPADVSVLSPNGGESQVSNSIVEVIWSPATRADNYKLLYSLNNGAPGSWELIAQGLSKARYKWTVPRVNTEVPSVLVKVKAYDKRGKLLSADVSDTVFSISPAVVVTAPNGGETLLSGTLIPVTWDLNLKSEDIASIDVMYRKRSEKPWLPIALGLNSTATTVDWSVPSVNVIKNSVEVKVFLRDVAGKVIERDKSDNVFTLDPNGAL